MIVETNSLCLCLDIALFHTGHPVAVAAAIRSDLFRGRQFSRVMSHLAGRTASNKKVAE